MYNYIVRSVEKEEKVKDAPVTHRSLMEHRVYIPRSKEEIYGNEVGVNMPRKAG